MRKKFDRIGEAGDYTEPLRTLDPLIYELRKARYERNISQEALAKRIGCTSRTVRMAENGESSPKFYLMKVWAQALGLKLMVVKA